jgi:(p)ppGpp synthase/HD superfamily hydrolase
VSIGATLCWVRELHRGQVDQAGLPYIGHVERVAEKVRERLASLRGVPIEPGQADDICAAALLHDVLEDCPWISADDLRRRGYPDAIVETVLTLSYRKGAESYEEYLGRIAAAATSARC